MNTTELTPKQKKERITHLRELIEHPGWAILQEELAGDISITEAKLHGEMALAPYETIEGLQRERIDRLELKTLPTNLIKEYAEEDSEEPDFEVYETETSKEE